MVPPPESRPPAPSPETAAEAPPPGPVASALDGAGEQALRRTALRASIVKDVIQAVAITAAGIWALTTFWYREQYLPKRTDANVIVHGKLERLGERDGVVTVRLTATAQNPGRAVARLLGYTVTGYGHRVRPATGDAGLPPPPALDTPLQQGAYLAVSPELTTTRTPLTSYGSVFEPFNGKGNTTVRPDGAMEFEEMFLVPRGELALFEAQLEVAWLPVTLEARPDCYALQRNALGVVRIGATPGEGRSCRLSRAMVSQTLSLWDGAPAADGGPGAGRVGATAR